ATWRMSFESLNQLSATTIGGGSTTPRRWNAATRPSSMLCTQCSLSRHGPPGPGGLGRRMAKSTGTTSLPSPMTTTRRPPSIPESTRCSWPLHQVPTKPNCSPYFLNTESSATQVHCQRLRVAALLLAAERHSGTSTSTPKRLRRLIQERLGSAPSTREGRFLSHPRTRHSSVFVRQPKSGGEHGEAGDHAASASSSTCISGYQRLNTSPNSPFRVFTRVCNSRCAPRFVHCICCFLQNRLLTT